MHFVYGMVQRATWSPPAHHYGIGIVAGVILLYSHRALDTNPHFGLSWTALCQSSQPHCIRVPILVRNHISSFTHNLHEHSYYRELDKYAGPDDGDEQSASHFFGSHCLQQS